MWVAARASPVARRALFDSTVDLHSTQSISIHHSQSSQSISIYDREIGESENHVFRFLYFSISKAQALTVPIAYSNGLLDRVRHVREGAESRRSRGDTRAGMCVCGLFPSVPSGERGEERGRAGRGDIGI